MSSFRRSFCQFWRDSVVRSSHGRSWFDNRGIVGSEQFNCGVLLRVVSSLHPQTSECYSGGGTPAIVVPQHKRPSPAELPLLFIIFGFSLSLEGSEQRQGRTVQSKSVRTKRAVATNTLYWYFSILAAIWILPLNWICNGANSGATTEFRAGILHITKLTTRLEVAAVKLCATTVLSGVATSWHCYTLPRRYDVRPKELERSNTRI
jgi:hypothetical protein